MQFEYRAKDTNGRVHDGVVVAGDRREAARKLGRDQLFVVDLIDSSSRRKGRLPEIFRRRPSDSDLADVTHQIADLLGGGLPLALVLETMIDETRNVRLRSALESVHADVEEGISFSQALHRRPDVFPFVYSSMVASGEETGRVPEVLENIAIRLEKDHEIWKKVRTALVYPTILVVVGIATAVLLVTLVIPRLAELFADLNQTLPLPTRVLIGVSGFVQSYGLWLLVVALAAWASARFWLRTQRGGLWLDASKLRLPYLGDLLLTSETARFGHSLALLLRSGLTLMVALEVVEKTLSNRLFRREVLRLQQRIAEGHSLSAAMRMSNVFGRSLSQMVAVGESANDPAGALERISGIYRRRVDQAARVFSSVIEPTLVVTVGLLVGFVVFSMMLPILQIDVMGVE